MIRLGGREIPWRPGMTVADLLREHGGGAECPVVRVNEEFVSRPNFAAMPVPDGAEVFIIPMIAGG
jgi:thiamine biosynthesis protein ThiS